MATDTQKVASDLYKQVNLLREQRGIGWETLAREVGMGRSTIWRFVGGEMMSLKTYLLLSEWVGQQGFKDYSPEQRDKMAKSGEAMPDGSYPIADCEDLKNAIQAIGRAKDPEATKKHIKKRKNALDCPDVDLPEDWASEEMCPEGKHRMPDGTCMDDDEMALAAAATFTVHGDTDLPITEREYEWDGGEAAERVFDHFAKGEDENGETLVDVDGVGKAFLWANPDLDPQQKGAWGLGFADIVGGELMIVPRGLAAVAGGHGVGQIDGINTDEIDQIKIKICKMYARVQEKFSDWPDCPHGPERANPGGEALPPKDRRDRSDRENSLALDGEEGPEVTDLPEGQVVAANGGQPIEGIIAIEGLATGDQRMLERGSVEWDEEILPVPLIWDRAEGDHTGMTVGSIHEVERIGDEIHAKGFLSASEDPETRAAVQRVAELFNEGAVGVSVALDHVDSELRVKKSAIDEGMDFDPAAMAEDEDGRVVLAKMMAEDAVDVTTKGNLRHVAVVDTAAIAKAKMRLSDPQAEEVVEIAASGTLRIVEFEADTEAFSDPAFGVPGVDPRLLFDPHNNRWSVPPTVDEHGRVFGHIAPWGICLRGRPDKCITPPNADLSGFMRGAAPLAGGMRTGVICVGASHSATGIGAEAATKHYDKTGRAVADVRVGMDAYGVWFAGRLRPGADPDDIYAFKASDVSGHWEVGKNGQMTLCGLPAVNVGGFPKGYLTAEEVAMAASATLLDEDCGCEEGGETDALQEVLPEAVLSEVLSEERLARLEASLDRIAKAVAPMYASHLASLIPDEE